LKRKLLDDSNLRFFLEKITVLGAKKVNFCVLN
jgi:hypothetical protein